MKIQFVDEIARARLNHLEEVVNDTRLVARKAQSQSTYFKGMGHLCGADIPINEVVIELLKELGLDATTEPASPTRVRLYKIKKKGRK